MCVSDFSSGGVACKPCVSSKPGLYIGTFPLYVYVYNSQTLNKFNSAYQSRADVGGKLKFIEFNMGSLITDYLYIINSTYLLKIVGKKKKVIALCFLTYV